MQTCLSGNGLLVVAHPYISCFEFAVHRGESYLRCVVLVAEMAEKHTAQQSEPCDGRQLATCVGVVEMTDGG